MISRPVRDSRKVDIIPENGVGGCPLVSACICMHALVDQTHTHIQTLVYTCIHEKMPPPKSLYQPASSKHPRSLRENYLEVNRQEASLIVSKLFPKGPGEALSLQV